MPTPVPEIVAFVAFEMLTVKVSFGSAIASPTTWIVIVWVSDPGANVRTPLFAA